MSRKSFGGDDAGGEDLDDLGHLLLEMGDDFQQLDDARPEPGQALVLHPGRPVGGGRADQFGAHPGPTVPGEMSELFAQLCRRGDDQPSDEVVDPH